MAAVDLGKTRNRTAEFNTSTMAPSGLSARGDPPHTVDVEQT
jgi:hypothetical protein